MATRNVFVCTDTDKAKELGFVQMAMDKDFLVYTTNCKYRIWIYLKKQNMISFIHHSFDSYNMFKQMIEAGIIEVKQIKTYNKDTKIEQLEKRIFELESRLNNNDK